MNQAINRVDRARSEVRWRSILRSCGTASRWYQAAVREKAGQIIAAGMTRKVNFEAVIGDVNRRIDDAYRAKYSASPYLDPMIGERARAATVRITPLTGGA